MVQKGHAEGRRRTECKTWARRACSPAGRTWPRSPAQWPGERPLKKVVLGCWTAPCRDDGEKQLWQAMRLLCENAEALKKNPFTSADRRTAARCMDGDCTMSLLLEFESLLCRLSPQCKFNILPLFEARLDPVNACGALRWHSL